MVRSILLFAVLGFIPASVHAQGGASVFKYHELPSAPIAEHLSKGLNLIYRNDDTFRCAVANPTRLFIWADPKTHAEIAEHIKFAEAFVAWADPRTHAEIAEHIARAFGPPVVERKD